MTGRTVLKYARAYVDGYDMSGYTRSFGPLSVEFEEHAQAALSDDIINVLPGQATIGMGTLNGIFDNTATSGLHVIMSGSTGIRTVMLPIGMRAAPVAGDEVFCGQFDQTGYQEEGDGLLTVTIPFAPTDNQSASKLYSQAWGKLLHANSAETAANSTASAGINNGAATALGGFMMYQVFSGAGGDGTATISIDDSANDTDYSALSGATTGELDMSVVRAGIVALGATADVRQYLRWQLALNGATTVTFALAFVRGNGS